MPSRQKRNRKVFAFSQQNFTFTHFTKKKDVMRVIVLYKLKTTELQPFSSFLRN